MSSEIVEEAPGHRIDPRGHCRCGWEARDAAFHWTVDLPTLGLPVSPAGPSGTRSQVA